MQFNPTDPDFEPSKRYLVVIPSTGYFQVDSFEELLGDLRPEYRPYAQSDLPNSVTSATTTETASAIESEVNNTLAQAAKKDLAKWEDEEVLRQTIVAELARNFVQQFQLQQSLRPQATAPIDYKLEMESGILYWPYKDTPLPISTPDTLVVTYENLVEVEAQLRLKQITLQNFRVVLPLHDPELFFRALHLAGLVAITDLTQSNQTQI